MRINKFCSLIGLSTVLLLGPLTAAQAQKPGLYVGAGVGAYSIDESDLSENDHVIKAYVGGQFTNWFGAKARGPTSTAPTAVATGSRRMVKACPWCSRFRSGQRPRSL